MQTLFKTCVLGVGLCGPLAAQAQDLSFEGDLGLTARTFFEDGALEGQIGKGTSLIGSLRLASSASLSFGQVVGEIRGRKDEKTGAQSWDLSKAYVAGELGRVRWLVGSDVVFWGVTESYNPVNIVNQRGNFTSSEEVERLGQPMVSVSFDTDRLGTFSFYGLVGLRELDYEEADQRLRFDVVPDSDRVMFEAEDDIDVAIRNSNSISTANGSLDYAVSLFSGRDRQPVYLPGCAFKQDSVDEATCDAVNANVQDVYEGLRPSDIGDDPIAAAFDRLDPASQVFLLSGNSVGAVPYYQQMRQIGLELVYSTGDWQLKFDGAKRFTDREDYFSGVIGAEYSFGDLFSTGGGLTGAVEYIYDDRSDLQPRTFLDDDVFVALRYDLNNVANTSLSLSGLKDLQTDSTLVNFNISSRLTDSAQIEFSTVFINADDTSDPLSGLDDDDFMELSLTYFF
ncbi:hypothetical protein [Marivita sp.]|uniref:hypothetical protein n=1 Tax=Marivita sp. TaxID=2003365 RepID=UPI003F6F785B